MIGLKASVLSLHTLRYRQYVLVYYLVSAHQRSAGIAGRRSGESGDADEFSDFLPRVSEAEGTEWMQRATM